MEKKITIEQGFTHSGQFHSDDVFSTALLRILNPEIQITRGNTVPEDFEGIVYDIGGGKFDHHQKEKEYRENEMPYAAFGLLWREYGKLLVDEEDALDFDHRFIEDLDLSDNTGSSHSLALAISDFNPSWDDEETDVDARFWEAVDLAQKILTHKIERIKASARARSLVEDAMAKSDGKILILDRFMPWKRSVRETEFLYAIYPSNRGGYSIQAVPKDEKEDDQVVLKLPFPESWRAATPAELQKESGVAGARFCHASGFLAAAETLESAIALAKTSIKAANENK